MESVVESKLKEMSLNALENLSISRLSRVLLSDNKWYPVKPSQAIVRDIIYPDSIVPTLIFINDNETFIVKFSEIKAYCYGG